MSSVIADAVFDFGQPRNDLFSTTPEPNPIKINQPVYAEAFAQLLQQLDQNNQSALVQAFADAIGGTMTDIEMSHNVRPDYTGPLIELAHAANLDQSFVYAFQQVSTIDVNSEFLTTLTTTSAYAQSHNTPTAFHCHIILRKCPCSRGYCVCPLCVAHFALQG